jgi:hypothetical protein
MIGYPSLHFVALQGLIVALVLLTPWLALAFGAKLKVTGADVALFVPVYPVFALVTVAIFLPFEGDWADMAFRPILTLRPIIVGGAAVVLGTVLTQWRNMSKRGISEVAHRLGAAFLIGALWGAVWGISGWALSSMGIAGNG